jgi:MarR family transcriptional regulator, negative regulator of the multidrug operon emrRAB
MHIEATRNELNVIAAWATAVADAVREVVEASTGVGGAGPAALVAIVADPGLSIDELRRVLGITHPGTVRLVDRLVEQGWVRREAAVGRQVRLRPTRNGRRVEHRLVLARESAVRRLHAALSDVDVRQIAETVAPALEAMAVDLDRQRRLCRLCDRACCASCPVRAAGEKRAEH